MTRIKCVQLATTKRKQCRRIAAQTTQPCCVSSQTNSTSLSHLLYHLHWNLLRTLSVCLIIFPDSSSRSVSFDALSLFNTPRSWGFRVPLVVVVFCPPITSLGLPDESHTTTSCITLFWLTLRSAVCSAPFWTELNCPYQNPRSSVREKEATK